MGASNETFCKIMQTILNKVLLCYANSLVIEYIDSRTASIRFLERSTKCELEDKLRQVYLWDKDYKFDWIEYGSHNFNSNGIETTAIIKLKAISKPFYIEDEPWVRPEIDYKRIITSHVPDAYFNNGRIIKPKKLYFFGKSFRFLDELLLKVEGLTEDEAWRNLHMLMFPKHWTEVIQPPKLSKKVNNGNN